MRWAYFTLLIHPVREPYGFVILYTFPLHWNERAENEP